ncbi:MAG: STAS domain-containing protein [Gemmatimonadaceae bacterium]|nr:STAS domain-containing protein [Gemmatimonadaceae bacterium]NUS98406.1 STAS domain-containing protein [Gemmatimonadaceae bacterium]
MEIVRLPKVNHRHIASEAQQKSPIPQPAGPAMAGRTASRAHLRLLGGGAEKKDGSALRAEPVDGTLMAPERLVADTRASFRKDALNYLDRAEAQSVKDIALDMSKTVEMDASGLGILVVVQKKAKELEIRMRIRKAPQQVRYLLLLTKLEHLFEFED